MIEETSGGLLGDLALDSIFYALGIPFILFIGLFVGFRYLTMDTAEDFIEAKANHQNIVCDGLIKTYTISFDKYLIEENVIVMSRLILNKKFNIADCDIQ